jgi:hypothetical protein
MDDQTVPGQPAPRAWVEALDEAEAQVAAGQAVPAAEVHDLLHEAIARIEAGKASAGPPRRR